MTDNQPEWRHNCMKIRQLLGSSNQPSNTLSNDGDIVFCAAPVALTNDQVSVHLNNFTDSPYTLERGTQVANFTVLTPEQMKVVKPIDTVTTWHLLHDNPENAAHYASSLIKSTKPEDSRKTSGFPQLTTLEIFSITHQFKNEFCPNCAPLKNRHRFDIGMNEEFKVKITPKDNSPAYSQNLPTPIN